jgi:hypothetical protein
VLLQIPKVAVPDKFIILAKVFEVLMARQAQSRFHRHHSTTAAGIKGHGGHTIEYGRWSSNGVGAFGFLSGV